MLALQFKPDTASVERPARRRNEAENPQNVNIIFAAEDLSVCYSAILERRLLASLWLGEVRRPRLTFSLSCDLQPK